MDHEMRIESRFHYSDIHREKSDLATWVTSCDSLDKFLIVIRVYRWMSTLKPVCIRHSPIEEKKEEKKVEKKDWKLNFK